MPVDEKLIQPTAPTAPGPDTPTAVRVEDLHKTFRIPLQRVDSFKERAVHPFAAREFRELHALDGISFEIRKGEFFGIVGRNGSGKSTLLKLLASIYRADSGRIQIAGRMAPFIELGVGFNLELTARENVILNGVMMGLTPKEVRRRIDSVIDFAELQEFVDLKLKNYSSGMLVRLAFSVMMEADADVLLIDEVLAVGDASFQQKCADAFHRMKAEGKTIVLVTHEMGAVEAYCHRAMLLSDGVIQYIGDPTETSREYMKLNFAGGGVDSEGPEMHGEGAKVLRCRVEDENGEELTNVERGEPIRLRTELELLQAVPGLYVGFVVTNAEGLGLFEFGTSVSPEDGDLLPGRRVTVTSTIENPLSAGRHYVNLGIQSTNGISIYGENAVSFVIYGAQQTKGLIAPEQKSKTIVENAP
jgi:ABC-type polysaccharide/polyol phosphate transport system ATPase subunit